MRHVKILLIVLLFWTGSAWAVPETVSVRLTDVTPSSFSVVWLTDVAAAPLVEVYGDATMTRSLQGAVTIVPMPGAAPAVQAAARSKGIMKVRVSGLVAGTKYWVRTVTRDPANESSIGYSSLLEVTTANSVIPYQRQADGRLVDAGNDLLAVRVYIRPADTAQLPGLGDLLLLESNGTDSSVSAFVGEGALAPEGILDLNNLFFDHLSLDVQGEETTLLRIYRGGTLSTLLHYRRLPADSGLGGVGSPEQGFFADVNLDGQVDTIDFAAFREQFRLHADDGSFNPDFNFMTEVPGETGVFDRIDALDFARFAPAYGQAGVE